MKLSDWQVLEFEERAFWAVARSRLELDAVEDHPQWWDLKITNSVVENVEQINVRFEAASGRVLTRSRVSRGKEQRMKTYQYEADHVLRERREPGADPAAPAEQWPVGKTQQVPFPTAQDATPPVVSSPYLLLLLAQRLQARGENQSQDVLVHTDLNFYRVRMSTGNGGVPIEVNYKKTGAGRVTGKTETLAVSLNVAPAGTPQEDPDFSLFGLQGDIILFFDRNSGLPLQVRGAAPRIGDTAINLKAVTLRETAQ